MLKELGAKWLVEMTEYISKNPEIIVNGFIRAGICGALDDKETEDHEEVDEIESDDIDWSEDELEYDNDEVLLMAGED